MFGVGVMNSESTNFKSFSGEGGERFRHERRMVAHAAAGEHRHSDYDSRAASPASAAFH
jgi:hypothetical protein